MPRRWTAGVAPGEREPARRYHTGRGQPAAVSSVAFSLYDGGDSDDSELEDEDAVADAEAPAPPRKRAGAKTVAARAGRAESEPVGPGFATAFERRRHTHANAAKSIEIRASFLRVPVAPRRCLAAFQLGLLLVLAEIGDSRMPAGYIPAGTVVETENIDLWTFIMLSLAFASLWCLRSVKSEADPAAACFLSRAQANEWKGWMQVAFVASRSRRGISSSDESRRRRGRDADISRVATTPRPRRGYSVESRRRPGRDADIPRRRRRRGRDADIPRRRVADADIPRRRAARRRYMRVFGVANEWPLCRPPTGKVIGDVIASNVDDVFVGQTVKVTAPWRTFTWVEVGSRTLVEPLDPSVPPQIYLGLAGSGGRSAKLPLDRIAKPGLGRESHVRRFGGDESRRRRGRELERFGEGESRRRCGRELERFRGREETRRRRPRAGESRRRRVATPPRPRAGEIRRRRAAAAPSWRESEAASRDAAAGRDVTRVRRGACLESRGLGRRAGPSPARCASSRRPRAASASRPASS